MIDLLYLGAGQFTAICRVRCTRERMRRAFRRTGGIRTHDTLRVYRFSRQTPRNQNLSSRVEILSRPARFSRKRKQKPHNRSHNSNPSLTCAHTLFSRCSHDRSSLNHSGQANPSRSRPKRASSDQVKARASRLRVSPVRPARAQPPASARVQGRSAGRGSAGRHGLRWRGPQRVLQFDPPPAKL